MAFSFLDFLGQMSVLVISLLKMLTKEGYSDVLAPEADWHYTLTQLGFMSNLNLIAIFAICHLNQSKYIGISRADSI